MDKKNRELELVNEKTAREVEEITLKARKTAERKQDEEERKVEDAQRRKAQSTILGGMMHQAGQAGGCAGAIAPVAAQAQSPCDAAPQTA